MGFSFVDFFNYFNINLQAGGGLLKDFFGSIVITSILIVIIISLIFIICYDEDNTSSVFKILFYSFIITLGLLFIHDKVKSNEKIGGSLPVGDVIKIKPGMNSKVTESSMTEKDFIDEEEEEMEDEYEEEDREEDSIHSDGNSTLLQKIDNNIRRI